MRGIVHYIHIFPLHKIVVIVPYIYKYLGAEINGNNYNTDRSTH